MKERNYGLDLLRVLAMLGIVILHINGAGGVLGCCEKSQVKFLSSNWVEICAYTSVDIFGLLSGYLGLYKKKNTCYRTLELICIVLFYCMLITLVFIIFLPTHIVGFKNILIGIFPQIKGRYWYITCYIPVAIFQPYINKMILSLSEKEHFRLSLLIIAVFGFIQSFVIVDLFTFKSGYSFVWLLCLYIIGAYIKRVELLKDTSKTKLAAIFLGGSIVLLLGNAFVKAVIHRNINFFVSYISPVILLMSGCLLLLFRDIEFNSIKGIIPFLSMVTFDVYLIHCHILIYDNYITDGFMRIADYNAILIPIFIVLSAIVILIVTSVIGGFRTIMFKIIKADKLIKTASEKIDKIIYC